MVVKRALVALLLAALVAGCGSGDTNGAGLTKFQQDALVAQLEAARVAAAAGDVGGAQKALTAFRRSIAGYRRDGALTAATTSQLRAGAQRVLARIKGDAPAPAPTAPTPAPAAPTPTETATTPTPVPAPPKRAREHRKKKPEKRGKGKREKDD